MKKIFNLISFLLLFVWAFPVFAQRANPQTFCRVRDAQLPNNIARVTQLQLTMPNTFQALSTRSGNYFYTGAIWRATMGGQLNADGIAAATWGTNSRSFLLGYDTVAGNWNRATIHAAGDALAAAQDGIDVLSYNLYYDGTQYRRLLGGDMADNLAAAQTLPWVGAYNLFYDGTNHRRWLGGELSSDAVPTTLISPYVGNFDHKYQTDDDVWARDGAETADGGTLANNVNAVYRFALDYGYDSSAAAWRYVNTLDAVADGLALSLNWKTVAAVQLYYNGTTLDMGRVGATGGIQNEIVNWPNAYDHGNAWVNGNKKNTAEVTPNATTGTAVDDAGTDIVLASTEIINDVNFCVWVKNAGGGSGDAFNDVDVSASPDGTEWVDLGWASCDTLTTGNTCVYCVSGNAYRYIRVIASCGAGDDTTADTFYTANKG